MRQSPTASAIQTASAIVKTTAGLWARKHLPNHETECPERDGAHRGAAGIETYGETTSDRRTNTGLLLFLALVLVQQHRSCRKDRRKSQKQTPDLGSEFLGD